MPTWQIRNVNKILSTWWVFFVNQSREIKRREKKGGGESKTLERDPPISVSSLRFIDRPYILQSTDRSTRSWICNQLPTRKSMCRVVNRQDKRRYKQEEKKKKGRKKGRTTNDSSENRTNLWDEIVKFCASFPFLHVAVSCRSRSAKSAMPNRDLVLVLGQRSSFPLLW